MFLLVRRNDAVKCFGKAFKNILWKLWETFQWNIYENLCSVIFDSYLTDLRKYRRDIWKYPSSNLSRMFHERCKNDYQKGILRQIKNVSTSSQKWCSEINGKSFKNIPWMLWETFQWNILENFCRGIFDSYLTDLRKYRRDIWRNPSSNLSRMFHERCKNDYQKDILRQIKKCVY